MERVGIVCASDTELAPFLERMEKGETVERAMLEFREGAIGKTRVVAVYSGVCKVNATIATQLLVDVFQVDAVVNAGTAGGMREDVRLFDTIVAERTAYHDVADDVLTEFHPWMPSVYFQADERLLDAAKGYGRASKYPVLFGSIVTCRMLAAGFSVGSVERFGVAGDWGDECGWRKDHAGMGRIISASIQFICDAELQTG
nr:5'-methylthioadenosine/S-adenosylhomocysteine nucleosidase [Raoultibacter timonensis]